MGVGGGGGGGAIFGSGVCYFRGVSQRCDMSVHILALVLI